MKEGGGGVPTLFSVDAPGRAPSRKVILLQAVPLPNHNHEQP